MTETATVTAVNGNEVTVVCKSEESCGGCSGMFCSADAHSINAIKDTDLDVSSGDVVDLYIPPGKTMFQGFIVLVFPLVLFIAAFIIVGALIPAATEGIKVIFGLTGLSTGFGVSFLYGRATKKTSMPKITGLHSVPHTQSV